MVAPTTLQNLQFARPLVVPHLRADAPGESPPPGSPTVHTPSTPQLTASMSDAPGGRRARPHPLFHATDEIDGALLAHRCQWQSRCPRRRGRRARACPWARPAAALARTRLKRSCRAHASLGRGQMPQRVRADAKASKCSTAIVLPARRGSCPAALRQCSSAAHSSVTRHLGEATRPATGPPAALARSGLSRAVVSGAAPQGSKVIGDSRARGRIEDRVPGESRVRFRWLRAPVELPCAAIARREIRGTARGRKPPQSLRSRVGKTGRSPLENDGLSFPIVRDNLDAPGGSNG